MAALAALLQGRLEGLVTQEEFGDAKRQLNAAEQPPMAAASPGQFKDDSSELHGVV